MSRLAVLIFSGALVLLAGCVTTPTEPPPDWAATNQVSHAEIQPLPKPELPQIQTNIPLVEKNAAPTVITVTNPPPPPVHLLTGVSRPHPPPIFTWKSLRDWASDHKLAPPALLSRSPLVSYTISSDRGVMVLSIGSREAVWNGVVVHLGFAPEIIDGEIHLHGLDFQRTLEPFLCEPPLAFGANRTIVIDPGHGGINAGTISVLDRRPEKDFTLDWARRLQPLLEQEGWRVFLTRTNDVDISLSNRVLFAESHHADLFVSLHFNSLSPDPKPAGLATFVLTPVGMPSNVTRGYSDALFQNFPNNSFDNENVLLADLMQRAILHVSSMEDRGINRARFIGVLRGQHRPAVLIEAGFLSNPREAKRIADPEFRQKLAEAVAGALK